MHDNKELINNSDMVILAVKPNIVPYVLEETKNLFDDSKTMVSIAAGIKLSQLQNKLQKESKVRL